MKKSIMFIALLPAAGQLLLNAQSDASQTVWSDSAAPAVEQFITDSLWDSYPTDVVNVVAIVDAPPAGGGTVPAGVYETGSHFYKIASPSVSFINNASAPANTEGEPVFGAETAATAETETAVTADNGLLPEHSPLDIPQETAVDNSDRVDGLDLPRLEKIEIIGHTMPDDAVILEVETLRFYIPDRIVESSGLDEPIPVGEPRQLLETFWRQLRAGSRRYEQLYQTLRLIQQHPDVTDQLLYRAIAAAADHYHSEQRYSRELYAWFMLTSLNIECRLAFDNRMASYLLLPEQSVDFSHAVYMEFNADSRYAVLKPPYRNEKDPRLAPPVEALLTTEATFAVDGRLLAGIYTEADSAAAENGGERQLDFNYNDQQYQLIFKYRLNSNSQTETGVKYNLTDYFTISAELATAIETEMKPLLDGRPEAVAANILLRFIQVLTANKRPDTIDTPETNNARSFDKLFLTDQTTAVDGRMAAAFYSYLVKRLLGLDSLVLRQNDSQRLLTAVLFTSSLPGSTFFYKNNGYTLCDPLTIGSDISVMERTWQRSGITIADYGN